MRDIDDATKRWPKRTWRGSGRVAALLCGQVGVLCNSAFEAYKITGQPCRRPDGYMCNHCPPEIMAHRVESLDRPQVEVCRGRDFYGTERL